MEYNKIYKPCLLCGEYFLVGHNGKGFITRQKYCGSYRKKTGCSYRKHIEHTLEFIETVRAKYKNRPDKIKEFQKNYRIKHKDELSEKHKQLSYLEYHKNYRIKNNKKIKKYRIDNKDRISELGKIWYNKNKEEVLRKKKERYIKNKVKL